MTQYTDLMDDTTHTVKITSDTLVKGISNVIKHYNTAWNKGQSNPKPAIINISITMWKSSALENIVQSVSKP
jgi:hypothetical protein